MNEKQGCWVTLKNGTHIFVEDGKTIYEAIEELNKSNSDKDKSGGSRQKKMTPAEKIASVHIDRARDNVLPELGEEELKSIGATKSKPVLVKKNIIGRNAERHKEISDADFETIIATALYDSPEVFRASSTEPYYHFAKFVEYGERGSLKMGLCLLDVSESKDCFEVVHAYVVNGSKFEETKNAVKRK